MKYAQIVDNAVVELREMRDDFDPATVAHKFDWRPTTDIADPTFDPTVERLGGVVYAVNGGVVEGQREIIPLTPEQIATRARALELKAQGSQLRNIYVALKDGTGNAGERMARVESVVAWIMRDALGV